MAYARQASRKNGTMMDVDTYLKRIEYVGPVVPTMEVLENLCWCHVTHIPFYTLDLFGSSERKVMDLRVVYRRLIIDGLGGLCYELNGLFSWLLRQIGFQVAVIRTDSLMNGKYGGSLVDEHLTLIVTFPDGQKRIADVSCLALPLRFDHEEPQDHRNTKARAIRRWSDEHGAWYIYVEKLERTSVKEIQPEHTRKQSELSWRGRFRFRLDATDVDLRDFQANLDATVDTSDTIFKTTSFCVLQTERGIKALISFKYIEKDYFDDFTDIRRALVVKDHVDLKRILRETFNIILNYEPAIPENKEDVY